MIFQQKYKSILLNSFIACQEQMEGEKIATRWFDIRLNLFLEIFSIFFTTRAKELQVHCMHIKIEYTNMKQTEQ